MSDAVQIYGHMITTIAALIAIVLIVVINVVFEPDIIAFLAAIIASTIIWFLGNAFIHTT